MASFKKDETIQEFQKFIGTVYDLPDDRLFSIFDLLSNQHRFTMRALKGIRKSDFKRLEINLLIAISWLMAIANRLHINVEDTIWKRFPYVCSYCAKCPCLCKKNNPTKRKSPAVKKMVRPKNFSQFQQMMADIYPPKTRSLAEAGIHLAEEMGELSEAIHIYLGEHFKKQFTDIENEMADYFSTFLGVANSAKIDLALSLSKMYSNNCHACHKAPCICSFSFVPKFKS